MYILKKKNSFFVADLVLNWNVISPRHQCLCLEGVVNRILPLNVSLEPLNVSLKDRDMDMDIGFLSQLCCARQNAQFLPKIVNVFLSRGSMHYFLRIFHKKRKLEYMMERSLSSNVYYRFLYKVLVEPRGRFKFSKKKNFWKFLKISLVHFLIQYFLTHTH